MCRLYILLQKDAVTKNGILLLTTVLLVKGKSFYEITPTQASVNSWVKKAKTHL